VRAQGLIDATSDALRPETEIMQPVTEPETGSSIEEPNVTWVDIAKVLDSLRITQNVRDLRAVTVDASGLQYGFYFVSPQKKTFAVYRNGVLLQRGDLEGMIDMYEPAVFRMTASGDLLYALHGTDLYVNGASVSSDSYAFSKGVTSVHDEGGVLTFPEGGNIVSYDIHTGKRRVLYSHEGTIEYMRRKGATIAYTLRHRAVRMYKNGRLVSGKGVENPENFAIGSRGEVYFFTKSPRGYALFRDARSYVSGRGVGAYVDVDAQGGVWHMSYVESVRSMDVRLFKDRSGVNLLPLGIDNAELYVFFPEAGAFALRASTADEEEFRLVDDGRVIGEPFVFRYPYNDTHGFVPWNGSLVLRAYDGVTWRAYAGGKPLPSSSLGNVWFVRSGNDGLAVYATK
jgi:hypothetical protein